MSDTTQTEAARAADRPASRPLLWFRLAIAGVVRLVLASYFRVFYRVRVSGLAHLDAAGPKAVIVANHLSRLDAPILAAFLPGRPILVVTTEAARKWYIRALSLVVELVPIDHGNPFALKDLIHAVSQGRRCVLFPEARISSTGSMMKVYDGAAVIAQRTGAPLVPVWIEGTQFTRFNDLAGLVPRRRFPKIEVAIQSPRRMATPTTRNGAAHRRDLGRQLYDALADARFATAFPGPILLEALLSARRMRGGKAIALEDMTRTTLTYDRLLVGTLALSRQLERRSKPGEVLGLMLPNANGAAVSFLACHMAGRVPAMINFTAGPASIEACCEAAGIRSVFTSRAFVEKANLDALVERLSRLVRIVYLEDVRADIGITDKLRALASRPFFGRLYRRRGAGANDPAVILFTSGTEGRPKGVVLTHENILANVRQVAARVAFDNTDVMFNALPIFHCFGLTAGLMMGLVAGFKVFLYPSPLHNRVIPELCYSAGTTVILGTDTFLSAYAQNADPYDFHRMRYVVAGAEPLRTETRNTWMDKFGVRILEGYGATETAPVLAVNTPMHFKAGSVGRLLPGVEHRLEPIPGIDRGGRLWVRGPNVMAGYLTVDRPQEIQPPKDGWHDTGDVVDIDADGFVTIVGRAKRFAKIAGELVSLSYVEKLATSLWPDNRHAVVAVPDSRKGQSLILVTDRPDAARSRLLEEAKRLGYSELMVPRIIVNVDALPILGSGKTDYGTVLELVMDGMPKAAT